MGDGRRVSLIALVLAAALSGCAGVPTSGPVHLGTTLPSVSGVDDRAIHAYPQGPVDGQTPVEVVTQYLDAMVDNDSNYGVARRFLAAGTQWNSTSRIVLYRQLSLSVAAIRRGLVRASFNQVGVIDARGSYRVAQRERAAQFRLTRNDGQWQISGLAPGVLLSTADALRSLEPANLYFLTPAQNRLVPEPILVPPDEPGLATILVHALLEGPPAALASVVETAAPSGLDLVGNVPIDRDGNAEVNLSGGVQQLSAPELQRLSAQIGWTLRQIPTVTGIRLLENGTPLTDDGVPRVQPIGIWREYDPDGAPLSTGALLVKPDGTVVGARHTVPKAFNGRSLTAPVFSAGGARVAALRADQSGTTLLIGGADGPVHERLSAPVLSSPAFDPAGDVYVIEGSGPAARLVELPPTGAKRSVTVPQSVLDRGLDAVSISRDGTRVAMVAGPAQHSALLVGTLTTMRGQVRVTNVVTVIPADRDVAGVAWQQANRIVTTAVHGRHGRAVLRASIDGYRPHVMTNTGLPRRPTQVAAAPGQPLLATAAGAVWSLGINGWTRVSTGQDPSYAG